MAYQDVQLWLFQVNLAASVVNIGWVHHGPEAYFDQTTAEISMEAQLDMDSFGRGFHNPADHSTDMYKKYALATRIEVARCWKVGNLVGAYHALLPYALTHVEDEEIMLDIVRMLRSPAQKLTNYQIQNCVLQHLISGFSDENPENAVA